MSSHGKDKRHLLDKSLASTTKYRVNSIKWKVEYRIHKDLLVSSICANSSSRQRRFCFKCKSVENNVGSKLKIEQIKGE